MIIFFKPYFKAPMAWSYWGINSPAWGIGRHVLGQQIIDYWWDVRSNMVEHYADGDLVNQDRVIGYVEAGSDSLAVWGPQVPV